MRIRLHRIYDDSPPAGFRVLVDRLWPRGITKEKAALDGWWKALAPSAELRKWYHHEDGQWTEFRKRYLHELGGCKQEALGLLEDARGESVLVLLYGAKDERYNHAVVLKEYIERLAKRQKPRECASATCYGDQE